jgi:hypothetical protein
MAGAITGGRAVVTEGLPGAKRLLPPGRGRARAATSFCRARFFRFRSAFADDSGGTSGAGAGAASSRQHRQVQVPDAAVPTRLVPQLRAGAFGAGPGSGSASGSSTIQLPPPGSSSALRTAAPCRIRRACMATLRLAVGHRAI